MSQMKLNEEQKKLVEENHNLIYSFLKYRNLSLNAVEDWYGTAAIGLCKAAMAFDDSRGLKFSTLAYVCMERAVDCVKRKEKKNVKVSISLDEKIATNFDGVIPLSQMIPDPSDTFQSIYINDAVEKALKKLSDRDAAIIDTIISQDMTQACAAAKFGMSRANINRIYKNFITSVRDSFEYNGALIF